MAAETTRHDSFGVLAPFRFEMGESVNFGEPPHQDLLKSQMLNSVDLNQSLRETTELDDMRLSSLSPMIEDKIQRADDLCAGSVLTLSQVERLQLYVGDLESMLQRIRTLIIQYDSQQDEEMIASLLFLNDNVMKAITTYDLQIASHLGSFSTPTQQEFEEKEKEKEKEEEEEEKKKKIEIETKKGDCPVCWEDDVDGYEMPNCDHFSCLECWTEFLENKIQSGDVLDIICTNPECEEEVTPEIIESLISDQLFSKYQQFSFLARLRAEPNARYCPDVECGTPIVADQEAPSFPKLTCEKCSKEFCFHCTEDWHEGTCEKAKKDREKNMSKSEKKRKQKEEKDTKKYLKKNKTCKCRKCGALVQKASGCNHMECNCGHEFCWLCGETILTGGAYPLHYKTGACAGLQMSSVEELNWGRTAARYAINPLKYGLIGVGAVAGGAVALGVAVPAAAVALPVYGVYRFKKHRRDEQYRNTRSSNFAAPSSVPNPQSAQHSLYQSYSSDETFTEHPDFGESVDQPIVQQQEQQDNELDEMEKAIQASLQSQELMKEEREREEEELKKAIELSEQKQLE